MSDAEAEQTAEVQELGLTAHLSRRKAAEDLQIARARFREEETIRTKKFQQENFAFVAGPPRRYFGFTRAANGGIQVVAAEWTTLVSSVELNKEEADALIAALKEIQK